MNAPFTSDSLKLARFMEELSRHDLSAGDPGGDIEAAADRAGIDMPTAKILFARARRELGEQAI